MGDGGCGRGGGGERGCVAIGCDGGGYLCKASTKVIYFFSCNFLVKLKRKKIIKQIKS